jgi:hypothetical protein
VRTRARISVVESDAHDMTTEGCEVRSWETLGKEASSSWEGWKKRETILRDLIVRKMDSDSKKAINELFIEFIYILTRICTVTVTRVSIYIYN